MHSKVSPGDISYYIYLSLKSSPLRAPCGAFKSTLRCQAGTSYGESSKADLTQNFNLKTRMLRFSRRSRQKCRNEQFLIFLQQKK